MTDLEEIILQSTAIRGVNRFILWGWAAQIKDGDMAYASKESVAEFVGMSISTIKRHTHELVEAGWLIDTGTIKEWEAGCWTPVYRINVGKFAELENGARGVPFKFNGGSDWTGVQSERQVGFKVLGSRSTSPCSMVGIGAANPASQSDGAERQEPETKNQTPESPNPKPKVKDKTCPKCSEPWSRDKDHKCPAWMDNDPDNFRDMPPEPSRMDEETAIEEIEHEPFFEDGWTPGAKVKIPCKGENWGCKAITFIGWPDGWCPVCVGNGVEAKQGKATPRATPMPQPPSSAPPPKRIDFDEF